MRDTELYATILGLQFPWAITAVELDAQAETITVSVDIPPGSTVVCQVCDQAGC